MERLARVKRQRRINAVVRVVLAIAITIGLLIFFFVSVGRAMDNSIDNQNIMLCKSAEKSGNEQWLEKCQTYYETGEYEYLRTN